MKRLRLLLAEDHETVRDGLRLLFETQSDVEVLRGVADGQAAIDGAIAFAPDVLILDLSMPGLSGLAVATSIRERAPEVAIVVLTRHTEPAYVRELLAAGALGYVTKQSPFAELMKAVRAAGEGRVYIDQAVAPPVERGRWRRDRPPAPDAAHAVTSREMEVLRQSASGKTNKEVASALGIAVKTVEVHKSNAMRKLKLSDRAQMLQFATLKGWLDG